jgi:hypothetical protein
MHGHLAKTVVAKIYSERSLVFEVRICLIYKAGRHSFRELRQAWAGISPPRSRLMARMSLSQRAASM